MLNLEVTQTPRTDWTNGVRTDLRNKIGLSFAKAPVGDLRLLPSVLITSVNILTLDATNFGLGCLQTLLPPSVVSEDYLQLNVFQPANISADAKRFPQQQAPGHTNGMHPCVPVGAISVYNGTGLVAQSIKGFSLALTTALGHWGFLEGMRLVTKGRSIFGLMDQIAGLQWVQANIEAFGVTKPRFSSAVTIFGESTGAMSITYHLLGIRIKGLARAAVRMLTNILHSRVVLRPCSGLSETRKHELHLFLPFLTTHLWPTQQTRFACVVFRLPLLEELLEVENTSATKISDQLSFASNFDRPGGIMADLPSKAGPTARFPVIFGGNIDEGNVYRTHPESSLTSYEINAWNKFG
ncbi:hypothetical protein CVT25_004888 [Psilocybe cyanescens]|uniref:Carboxylesterase type B domain-containing protein n=1 Tax=Psilocybe cyanescens TaxID=93625 RepID=A0A409XBI9_PSICY|nr:hypothetical protein CVT25_004888 [Psilocybe cyanescens]